MAEKEQESSETRPEKPRTIEEAVEALTNIRAEDVLGLLGEGGVIKLLADSDPAFKRILFDKDQGKAWQNHVFNRLFKDPTIEAGTEAKKDIAEAEAKKKRAEQEAQMLIINARQRVRQLIEQAHKQVEELKQLANEEAVNILQQAERQAKRLREEAFQRGYEEGQTKAKQELTGGAHPVSPTGGPIDLEKEQRLDPIKSLDEKIKKIGEELKTLVQQLEDDKEGGDPTLSTDAEIARSYYRFLVEEIPASLTSPENIKNTWDPWKIESFDYYLYQPPEFKLTQYQHKLKQLIEQLQILNRQRIESAGLKRIEPPTYNAVIPYVMEYDAKQGQAQQLTDDKTLDGKVSQIIPGQAGYFYNGGILAGKPTGAIFYRYIPKS